MQALRKLKTACKVIATFVRRIYGKEQKSLRDIDNIDLKGVQKVDTQKEEERQRSLIEKDLQVSIMYKQKADKVQPINADNIDRTKPRGNNNQKKNI